MASSDAFPRAAPVPVPGDGLLHPVALAAVAVLVLNDHVGKQTWPGFATGKLSDVAGLFFFPLLLQALWEVAGRAAGRPFRVEPRVLLAGALATAVAFAAIQYVPIAGEAYRVGLGLLQWPVRALAAAFAGAELPAPARVHLTADPTDLLALPFAALAVLVGHRRAGFAVRHPASPEEPSHAAHRSS